MCTSYSVTRAPPPAPAPQTPRHCAPGIARPRPSGPGSRDTSRYRARFRSDRCNSALRPPQAPCRCGHRRGTAGLAPHLNSAYDVVGGEGGQQVDYEPGPQVAQRNLTVVGDQLAGHGVLREKGPVVGVSRSDGDRPQPLAASRLNETAAADNGSTSGEKMHRDPKATRWRPLALHRRRPAAGASSESHASVLNAHSLVSVSALTSYAVKKFMTRSV
jgi:hypothetical protein